MLNWTWFDFCQLQLQRITIYCKKLPLGKYIENLAHIWWFGFLRENILKTLLMVWFSAAAASKSPSCRILALQSSVCSTREMLQSSRCASNTLMQSSHWTFSTFSTLMLWLLYYFWHITANITLSHSFLWSWLYLQYNMLHFLNHCTVALVHCCNHCIVPNALCTITTIITLDTDRQES